MAMKIRKNSIEFVNSDDESLLVSKNGSGPGVIISIRGECFWMELPEHADSLAEAIKELMS